MISPATYVGVTGIVVQNRPVQWLIDFGLVLSSGASSGCMLMVSLPRVANHEL